MGPAIANPDVRPDFQTDFRPNEQFVSGEAVATIYSRLPGTLAVSFANATLIVLVIGDGGLSGGSLIWLLLIVLVSLARAAVLSRYRQDEERDVRQRFWVRASIVGAFCSGILWGIGPLLPFSQFSSYQWLWAFAIGGMCAGAASLHAAHLPSALAFMIPASLPLALSLLLQGSFQGIAAAIMTLAFIGLTTFTAILFSRDFERMLALRSTLEMRAGELDETNRRLSQEIDDHRHTSEALHQAQKMEALGNLTSGFAHDFNNILTVIIGNFERIANGAATVDNRQLAQAGIGAAQSGADLISRLLAFARHQPLVPQRTDIVLVVQEFRELLVHAVTGTVRVAFEIAPDKAMANVDAAQFQAMLLNLVVNARDAMPDGGLITIAVAKIMLGERDLSGRGLASGPFIAISVADTGEGMSPETLERAFEPFYTTKGDRGGTGLGLAQVYGFVRQSGGMERIESQRGRGTRVTIFLPEREEGEVEEALPAPEGSGVASVAEDDARLSVLLVDDNATVLHALETGLVEEGWSIVGAAHAEEAIAAIEAGGIFDIVITDIDMPGDMNGERLAQEVGTRFGIPVLLMSGASLSSAPDGSGPPVIAKPFRKQILVERVREIVDAARSASRGAAKS